MSTSKTSDYSLSMTALLHSFKIQLSSTNYLLWKNQIWPLLMDQGLICHIDGSEEAPPTQLTDGDKTTANPLYTSGKAVDRHAVILINSSLSEDAVSVTVGLTTAREIWQALETEYCNASVERVHNIRDKLRSLVKGSDSVEVFGHKFKALCDQLSAIGHAISDTDKLYWFTTGLGVDYISFTSIIRATRPAPSFQYLVAQAESHEVLLHDLQGQNNSAAAFVTQFSRPPPRGGGSGGGRGYNRSSRNYRGGRNNRGGRGYNGPRNNNRNSSAAPHVCQLCSLPGHMAGSCPSHVSYPTSEANLAKSFQAQCEVNPNSASWYADSGATDHMTKSSGSGNEAGLGSRSM